MTNFKISILDRDTDDGFVNTVHWTASQVDGDYTASTCNTISFAKEEGVNYVPYETLTESQVVDWVKVSLGVKGIAAIDTALSNNIAEQKAPKVVAGIPWSA